MLEQALGQLLVLLGVTVAVVFAFQSLRLPSSLAYLLVGLLLSSHTAGPVIDDYYVTILAQFGIVFLLFTIGLSFSFAHLYSLRHIILGAGTAQVVLTALAVGLVFWLLGVPAAGAFVIGAVFAQSSTTIITRQLTDQGENQTRHGRLATTLSVFQDVTAVPFVVLFPVLGGVAAQQAARDLGIASLKAVLAFAILFFAGKYLLRSLFHLVAVRRSNELFTITVLFVSLMAAWITQSLGLSMAFGAFLAGMTLGETEFRHQVESAIRPFRDVLLGLFFVSIGMLIQPALIPSIWFVTLLGAVGLLLVKLLLVTVIVILSGIDKQTALRIGMLLAVGGEFGFALLAIGLDAGLLDEQPAQVALMSVLGSMIMAPFLIRYNQVLAAACFRTVSSEPRDQFPEPVVPTGENHVIICGFGRIGQILSHFLEQREIPYVATDLDPARVREARLAGQPVFYGDSTDTSVLEALGVQTSRLLVISHDDITAALRTLHHLRQISPELPVMVRSRDEAHVQELRDAGATEIIPETLEAGMMMVSHVLLALHLPPQEIAACIEEQRYNRYQMLREVFQSRIEYAAESPEATASRLHPMVLTADSPAVGRPIRALNLDPDRVQLTALVRSGKRIPSPPAEMELQEEDVLVLFGEPDELRAAEIKLTLGSVTETNY
jgi:monovalent cation:H+ antiporter-2, CPA2 family